MNHDTKPFTVQDGLEVQIQDMKNWQVRLTDQCFSALQAEQARRNGRLSADANGYDVWRGCQLTEFITNWRPRV